MRINEIINEYKKIDKKILLTINGALWWKTGLFTYPEWFLNFQSRLLARKVDKQYMRIQDEIARMEWVRDNTKDIT